MNKEQKEVWKKLANKGLILSPRTIEALNPNTMAAYSQPAIDLITDLQEKLDDEYTVVSVNTVMDPSTLEPVAIVKLRKTIPYSEEIEKSS